MTNEVEPETIGDWAGHTPKPAATEDVDVFSFTLEQKPDNIVTQQLLGLRPYILLKPEVNDDGETLINIEAGGGAELDGLGEVLEGVGQLLQDPRVTAEIAEAVKAAQEKAEQDDKDE